MKKKHSTNRNLTLVTGATYNNLPLLNQKDENIYLEQYLERILTVLDKAFTAHPRTFAFRVDLRQPSFTSCPDFPSPTDHNVISTFFKEFKREVGHDIRERSKEGRRVHRTDIRYIWVKEIGKAGKPHYHLIFFLNNDTYYRIGDIGNPHVGLYGMLVKAWAMALDIFEHEANTLIHIPENAIYKLDANGFNFDSTFQAIFKRLSYFAKVDTKEYGNRERSFGYSYR